MGARILLVGDEPGLADRVRDAVGVGSEPFTVRVAAPDASAAALAAEPAAGILLDARSAAARGALTPLRAAHPDLPIVALVDEHGESAAAVREHAAALLVTRAGWLDRVYGVLRDVLSRGALEQANARLARGILIGREREQDALRAGIAAARTGKGGMLLVGGDAGIGKSALVRAVGRQAQDAGWRVVWGHCHEGGGAPPYRPWAQALRSLLWLGDLDPILDRLGRCAIDLAPLLPAVADRVGLPLDTATIDDDAARFRLFDSVATCLRGAAHRQPLLLLIEDLHSADPSSLRLLQFVAREIDAARVCIIATHRPADGHPTRPFDEALAALRQAPTHSALSLRGLSVDAVRALLSAIADHDVPADFAAAFHDRTEGNPLFVSEMARHLVEEQVLYFDGQQWTSRFTPEELPIPPSVADVIRRRLAHLSPACRDTLAAAAVVGREFDAALVGELADTPIGSDPAVLDEAVRGRVIAVIGDAPHTYRFAHPLIRETLYGDLPAPRRVQLHGLVARALETLDPSEREARVDELAYHFCEAAPDGDLDRALAYARRAGAHAAKTCAHEVTVRSYDMALRALRLAGAADDPRRADLLVLLGHALWRSGEFTRARQSALQAIEMARRVGAVDTLGRAALCYAGDLQGFGLVVCDDTVVALLDEALHRLDAADSPLRAALMARLAEELSIAPAAARRQALGQAAEAMARRLGDPAVLGAVLRTTHWALWTPEGVQQRLDLADEIIALATRAGDPALRLDGQLFRVWALLECGGATQTRAEIDHAIALVGRVGQSYYRWLLDTTRSCWAFGEGRLGDVEPCIAGSLAHVTTVDTPNVLLFAGVQSAHLRWMRGEFAQVAQDLRGFAEGYPLLGGVVQCSLAITASEAGDLGEARRLFEQLAANEFADLPRNVLWGSCIACLAEVCATIGDAGRADRLYELLLPFARQSIARPPVIVWASGAYYLARLATTMRRWDDAKRHFEDAIQLDGEMGRRHWVARAQVAYAEMLTESGERPEYALALLEDADATARALAMPAVTARVAALRRHLRPASMVEPEPTQPGALRGVFKQQGEVWTVGLGDHCCMLKTNRPVHRVKLLLRHPQHPIDALWLVQVTSAGAPPEDLPASYRGQSDTGPMLDARATRELVKQRRALDAAIEESRDADERERLRAERASIDRYLRAAKGLGGSDRPDGDRELARQLMHQSKKALVRRLREQVPALAEHFRKCIRIGFDCSYEPDPAAPITWEF